MGFVDSNGAPTIPPIDLSGLAGGFDGLAALLTGLPDGTGLVIQLHAMHPLPQIDGDMTITFDSGLADSADGSLTIIDDLGCLLLVELQSVDALSMLGDLPAGTIHIALSGAQGGLDGTITFDGTSTALVNVAVNGEGSYRFEINLLTGTVTEIT